jgi:short-subunit dehydrogenase
LIGSIVGWQGVPGQANYAASKAYVQNLAEGLHDDLKPLGVDVLAVAPGPVDSGFGARAGLRMNSATSPDVVATTALNALGRRRTVIPGSRAKFLTAALTLLPRRLRSLVLGKVIADMRIATAAEDLRAGP